MEKLKPAPVVGAKEDKNTEEIVHDRTVGRQKERYLLRGPTVFAPFHTHSEVEIDQISAKNKGKTVKKRPKPGAERYQKLENEPIRI